MPQPSRPFSVNSADVTLEMQVANMTFMLERLAQDCAPLQFVRELTQNAIEGIKARGGPGDVVWDVDWVRYDLEPSQGYKLAIIDNGIGMTGEELVNYINQLSSSMHKQSTHGNFGMGAKIAAAPRNPVGLVYVSWKEGRGSLIHLWKDPDTGAYGLRRHQNGNFWIPISDDIKPQEPKGIIKKSGTMVVLLGTRSDESTMDAPPDAPIPSRWIFRYLNTRYFRFPEGVTVKARENWTLPEGDKHRALRRVTGQEAFLKTNSSDSGVVELSGATARWWILKEKVDESGHYMHTAHVAALYDDELYELAGGRAGVARLQSFGIIFGYNRIVIYVQPHRTNKGVLTANTARTHLLMEGQPLPWTDWCTEFREKMPDAISQLMDKVAAGAGEAANAQSIRDRLKQIRELFRFTRYRPATDGLHGMDDGSVNAGGVADDGTGSSKSKRGGSRGGKGGRAGDIYALFADYGDTSAEEVGGLVDPPVKWVSILDGTRTKDVLEDRAAKYLPEVNMIQANADFRVFTDMIARWKRFYSHLPNAETFVTATVREWFQQQLVETVLGALALRRSGNWSEQEASELWTESALTAAVLPRYHVDLSIKRMLGQKLGTLKDKSAPLSEVS